MYKNIYRNMTMEDLNRKSKYFPERIELHALSGSGDTSVGFEYDDIRLARNACVTMRNYVRRVNVPLVISQRRNFMIAHK